MPASDQFLDILHLVRARQRASNSLVPELPKSAPEGVGASLEPRVYGLARRLRFRARATQILTLLALYTATGALLGADYLGLRYLTDYAPSFRLLYSLVTTVFIALMFYQGYPFKTFKRISLWSQTRLESANLIFSLNTTAPWATLVKDRPELALEFLSFFTHCAKEIRPLYLPLLHHSDKSIRLLAIKSLASANDE